MCGIAGIVDLSGAPIDRAVVAAMTRALAARGPDGEGSWEAPGVVLGHRRLSVIDLSPAGAQPMVSPDGQLAIVFNGEIYNHLDLRAELADQPFRSRSDTEVILRGYERWGDEVLARLDGMFAFALWDGRKRRLLAARDRLGKKPLYFAQVDEALVFASELKALRRVPGFDARVDPIALGQYLVMDHVPAPRTIHAGARKLGPAEALVIDGAGVRVNSYWDLPFPETPARIDEGAATEALGVLLRRAVERRLVGDVPIGAFLSGGLDSSAVVATLASLTGGEGVRTFSIGFDDDSHDESRWARLVSQRFGTQHQEERLNGRALLDALPTVSRFLDEPLADASIVPTYLLCQFTRREVKVVLGGDGGDELLAGYPTFLVDPLGALLAHGPIVRTADRLAARLPSRAGYMSLDFKLHQFLRGGNEAGPLRHQRWLASFVPEELPDLLTPSWTVGDPLGPVAERQTVTSARRAADRLMDFYLRFYLGGDVNTKVDRAAGAVGLEVRAPFEDRALVEFACALPAALRRRTFETSGKRLLKRLMKGTLPEEILRRPKQGFAVPVARWLREDLAPLLRDELAPAKLAREGHFDPQAVQRLMADHLSGRRDRRKQLWSLLTFQRWLAEHGPANQSLGSR